jgi:hypothetical protein
VVHLHIFTVCLHMASRLSCDSQRTKGWLHFCHDRPNLVGETGSAEGGGAESRVWCSWGKNIIGGGAVDSSELHVLCLEGGLVRVKDSALSQLRSVNVLNVPREMAGNELWHQPLVEMAIVPCIDSAGGEGCEWLGGPVVDSESSGLQVGLMGEASRSLTPGGAGLVEFKEGERAEDVGSPLNAYSPALGGLGYSEWVMQRANEIYPIIGMTFVGHKLQLLAFLTCIEEERRLGNGRTKGKREIKNLESSINYDAKGFGLIRGKRRARGLVVVP